jgi:hypothetical protein
MRNCAWLAAEARERNAFASILHRDRIERYLEDVLRELCSNRLRAVRTLHGSARSIASCSERVTGAEEWPVKGTPRFGAGRAGLALDWPLAPVRGRLRKKGVG